jgi:hypothetical protein
LALVPCGAKVAGAAPIAAVDARRADGLSALAAPAHDDLTQNSVTDQTCRASDHERCQYENKIHSAHPSRHRLSSERQSAAWM